LFKLIAASKLKISLDIIQACLKNKRPAQKQLFELLLPYLYSVCLRYLKDRSFAEDVLQESYLNIFRKMHQYKSNKANFESWAARIVINNCINYNKRVFNSNTVAFDIEEHEMILFPQIIENLSDSQLVMMLKNMPADYYEVFNLYVIDSYSHSEISEVLGIQKSLSRKRLSRAREWIKKAFIDKDLTSEIGDISFNPRRDILK